MNANSTEMNKASPELLRVVASYFQALAEPMRLQILNALRNGEKNVGELAQLIGCSNANTSRHLTLLTQSGLLSRQNRGNSVYYSIADTSIYELCDLVCGKIVHQLQETHRQHLGMHTS